MLRNKYLVTILKALTSNPHSDGATLSPKAGIRSNIEFNEKRNENKIAKIYMRDQEYSMFESSSPPHYRVIFLCDLIYQ